MGKRRITVIWLAMAVSTSAVAGCAGVDLGKTARVAAATTPAATGAAQVVVADVAAPGASFDGVTLELTAADRAFSASHFDAVAGSAFEIRFENRDSFKHAVYIVVGPTRPKDYSETDLAKQSAFRGDYITGPAVTTYHVAALPPGTYTFFCPVHQAMAGTIDVK